MTKAVHSTAESADSSCAAKLRRSIRREKRVIRAWQWAVLLLIFVFWWAMTKPGLIPPFFFENDAQAAFFFGEPVEIFRRIWSWFSTGVVKRPSRMSRQGFEKRPSAS